MSITNELRRTQVQPPYDVIVDLLRDELNKSADEWNRSNMFELARMCREAADTIWRLRDDLQRANTENAKLRELVRAMWHDGMCECDERGACAECEYNYTDRMRELGVDA